MIPEISFIVPIYNTAYYLKDCIESILNQTVSKEIILVDDGSNDHSLELCLAYTKSFPFITLIHSQNRGLSTARNYALDIAKGEYIYFIDSDDYILGNYFPDIVNLAKQQSADIIRLQAEKFVHGGNDCIEIPSLQFHLQPDKGYVFSGKDALNLMVQRGWIPGVCWTLIRRKFLLKHQLKFAEGIKAEDQLFYLQLLTVDPYVKLLELPYLIYRYRTRQGSITTTINAKYFYDHLCIINLINRYLIENNLLKDEIIYQSSKQIVFILFNTAINMLNVTPPPEKQECLDYLEQQWPLLSEIWDYFK